MRHRTWRTDHRDVGVRGSRRGGGLTLATLEASPGRVTGAPVLLVPGFTGSKEDFAAVLEPLAATGRHVVALDLPGQYESPGWLERGDHGFDRLAAAVRDVLEGLATQAGRRPHLVGHSLGGLVARSTVLADPDAAASLVLLDSGPRRPDRDGRRAALLAAVEQVASDGMPAIEARLRELEGDDPAVPPAEDDFLRRRFVASSTAGYLGMFDALLAEPDRVEDLARTGIPVRVVRGALDEVFPSEAVDRMATRLGGSVVVIPEADHSPALEHPGATVGVLATFWDEVEAIR